VNATPSVPRNGRFNAFLVEHEWHIIAAMAVVASGLGYIGFLSVVQPADWRGYLRAVTLTAHLFVLESNLGPREGLTWPLVIAQVLAPSVFGYAAVKATLGLFRDELRSLRIPLWRNHVVICGLGQKGSRLVREYRRKGIRVVGIEPDRHCPGVTACKRQGGVVLIGNAASLQMLQRAGVRRAKQVIAVSGDDGVNLEVGLELMRLKSKPTETRLGCFLHVSDTSLLPLVRAHALLRDPNDLLDVHLFNTSQLAARLLFEEYPLDYRPVVPGGCLSRAHLVVLGFGAVGESVVLQATRIGVLATGRKMRISVVDSEAPARESSFLRRYPAFREVADLEFCAMDLHSNQSIDRIRTWCEKADELATVAVCVQDNALALSVALTVSDVVEARVPVRVRLDRLHGLAALLGENQAGRHEKDGITPFGMLDVACTPEAIEGHEVDAMARAFHQLYLENRLRTAPPGVVDPALVPWHQLDPGLQDSNRQQADHVPVKLRAIGCFSAPHQSPQDSPFVGFEAGETDLLSRMEHRRWVTERLLAGWRFAPGPKDVARRTSPYLVPWDQLPDEIRQQDEASVKAIPHVLDKVGRLIRRVDGAA